MRAAVSRKSRPPEIDNTKERPLLLDLGRDTRWARGRVRARHTGDAVGMSILMAGLAISGVLLYDQASAGVLAGRWPWVLGTALWGLLALTTPIPWIKSLLRWVRHRGLELRLEPFPGAIGGYVGGYLQLPRGSLDSTDYLVRLSCVTVDTGGDSTTRRTRWANEGHPRVERGRNGRPILRFTFEVPDGSAPTRSDDGDGHEWEVGVVSLDRGSLLRAVFPVPVVEGSGSRRTTAVAPVTPLALERMNRAPARIERMGSRVRIQLLRGRMKGVAFALGLFGSISMGSGGFLATVAIGELGGGAFGWIMGGITGLMSAVFMVVGFLLLLTGVASVFGRSSLTLSRDSIEVKRDFRAMRTIATSDIDHVEMAIDTQMGAGADGTLGYRFKAVRTQGRSVVLASGVPGPSTAQRVSDEIEEMTGLEVRRGD